MRTILRRIWFLLRRDQMTRELEEEMRLHVELRAASLAEGGMSAEAARFAARRRFGRTTTIQERSRDMWGLEWLDHMRQDVRYAARRLRTRPAFSVPIVAVLALGVGATTAVFSAIDAALLRPLPFLRPSELVALTDVVIPFDQERNERFPLDIEDVAAIHDVFAQVAGFAAGGLNLSDGERPLRARVGVVTSTFFATLGVQPLVGRTFSPEEGKPNGPRAAVLSHPLWQRQFGGRDMLGVTIRLNQKPYTIVGVMPPGFSFPNESDLWIPLTVPTTFATFEAFRGWLPSRVVARLAPGVSHAAAAARLWAAWRQTAAAPKPDVQSYVKEQLKEVREQGATVPFQRELVGTRRTALLVLFGATGLLLLIVCANVANLLLSDAALRRREIAVREVLGATRRRIVRQLLVESLLLAVTGAALGIALAPPALGLLRAILPADLAGVAPARLDVRVLAFAAAIAVTTALAFGLWPALGTTRGNATDTIKASGGHGATSGTLGRARRALVVAELALTVMLLIGAGLMLRSFERVVSQETGIRADRVATLEMSVPRGTTAPRAERLRLVHAILDRLAGTPGIEAVGAVNDLPLRASGGIAISVDVDGMPKPKNDEMRFARLLVASGGYFDALGIPLLRGRTFTAADDSLAPKVAIINKSMAEKLWAGTDPVGRTFRWGGDSVPITVVGIAADVREGGLERAVGSQMYFPIESQTPDNIALVARGSLPARVMLSRLTDAVRAADRAQPVFNVRMMDEVLSNSIAPRRTNTVLIVIFAALALALSALGVYAVVSRGVAQRWRELGIRSALGATGRDLVALVSREVALLVAVGVALGLGGAWTLSRVIASLLYSVDVHDPVTFVAVPLMLIAPAAIATLVPALRAVRVSPTEVMRAD